MKTINIQDIFRSLNEAADIFPALKKNILDNDKIEDARDGLYVLIDKIGRDLENEDSTIHPLERINIKRALFILRNFISKRNERVSGNSFLSTLHKALREDGETLERITPDFIMEMEHLFKSILGLSDMYSSDGKIRTEQEPEYRKLQGRDAAIARSKFLDELAEYSESFIERYPSGLNKDVSQKRERNAKRILEFFGADEEDWRNYKWHLKNLIRDSKTLAALVELTDEEKKSIDIARKKRIPFGITPYYASLMDYESGRGNDHAVRSQVIPPLSYVEEFRSLDRKEMDFMHELDTSPVDLVTRRYPMIAIFKPYNTCAQICVYCQRNWEIEDVYSPNALATPGKIDDAINWFKENKSVKAVLITGGDPLVLPDEALNEIIGRFSDIPHIERIRIGTRTPVVLPFRFTDSLINILKKYHVAGKREICVVTHFEHPYEVTPESMDAVQKVKEVTSINFYNQQVFTIENSRRFETAALRKAIKFIGVDPYYIFHAKGKKETEYYIVPIARLIQERKEEARLTPGIVRTDEPVYNIPGVGKNHLRATQDHELIMLTPDGHRIYEMHPWEKAIVTSDTYIHEDVPIWTYLNRLKERGENIDDYKSIWYYY